jgi:hypothetical protein
MPPRSIERRTSILASADILAVAVLAASCAGESPPQAPVDAAVPDAMPSYFAVRGSATGVLGPVALELRLGDDVELLSVTEEGAFAFETRLQAGASYTVAFVDPGAPCTLSDQAGVIAGADAAIALTCTGASLASVVVSGIAPVVTLVPGTTEYVVDLPLSQPAVTLAATVATAGDYLLIAGAPVASGAPSAELTLSLGDNPVDIVVENAFGWQRTYRLTLRRAGQLAQYVYAKASNAGADDRLGYRVALSGDTLVAGAIFEDSAAQGVNGDQDDHSRSNSGAVYVFRRAGSAWLQEAYLKASNTGAGDFFGSSVALSGDVLAVGAFGEDSAAQGVGGDQQDNGATDSGAVYVFRRTGTTWRQEAYLKASNTGDGDNFGSDVALSGDTLAVGAYLEDSAAPGVGDDVDENDATDSGAVYVFRRTGATWLLEAFLKASNTGAGDAFGDSVALSGDTLAVGALFEASEAKGVGGSQDDDSAPDSGAVYVFRRAGTAWLQEAYLKASNTGAGDWFGADTALSGDTLAVGAYREDSAARGVGGNQADDSGSNSGAVYVFRRTGRVWHQEAYLKASNTGTGDIFGASVSLSGDTLAVGAMLEASAAKGVGGDQDDNTSDASGAVYVFRRTGAAWRQTVYLKASNTEASDRFGYNVALSSDTLAVGAIFEDSEAQGVGGNQDDDSAYASGALYIFH